MTLSFKEKSLLISLGAVLFVFGAYFYNVWTGDVDGTLNGMLASMIGVVIGIVIIHIAYHIVIALDDEPEPEDERDKAVGRRASVFSHWVLSLIIVAVYFRVIILGAWGESSGTEEITLFEIANLLLLGLASSEAANYAAQLYFYRKGV